MKKTIPDKSIKSTPEPEMELLLLQSIEQDKSFKRKGEKMEREINCPICNQSGCKEIELEQELSKYICNSCTTFIIEDEVLVNAKDIIKDNYLILQKYIKEYNLNRKDNEPFLKLVLSNKRVDSDHFRVNINNIINK